MSFRPSYVKPEPAISFLICELHLSFTFSGGRRHCQVSFELLRVLKKLVGFSKNKAMVITGSVPRYSEFGRTFKIVGFDKKNKGCSQLKVLLGTLRYCHLL